MPEVAGADFLIEDDCLAAAIFASGAGCSTEDKGDCPLAGVGVVAGADWLIGGGCLAVVGLEAGDGCLTDDVCLAVEAVGD